MAKNRVFSLFLEMVLNESSYYELRACTNPISGRILVLKLWGYEKLSGFLNQEKIDESTV